MARYHLNPRTGEPGQCRARISCPYGSLTEEHFDSPEEARAAYEAGQLDNAFTTLSKALDETLDPHMPAIMYGEGQSGKTAGGNVFAEDGKIVDLGDDELLEAINRAGWPSFDPAKGDDQFHYTEPAWVESLKGKDVEFLTAQKLSPEDQERYRKLLGGDEKSISFSGPQISEETGGAPELTDDLMQEMDAYYQENPLMSVDIDTSAGPPTFKVNANGELAYTTDREEVAALGNRLSKAGVWKDFQAVDLPGKENVVNRYVKRGLYYISDCRLDNEDKRREIGVSLGPKQVQQLKEIEADDKLLDIAGLVLIREAEAARGLKLFGDPKDTPPF